MKENVYKSKRFGQCFLTDESVVEDIVKGAMVTASDTVLEIGPGRGILTRALLESAASVIAVEIDSDLAAGLRNRFPGLKVIEGDILRCDIPSLLPRERQAKVVANIPYYITTPIIMRLLEAGELLSSITLMVQEEVALRLTASPGTKAYGALTLAVGYRAVVTYLRRVGRECFSPVPGVDSAIVRLDILDEPSVRSSDPELMFSLIRAAFGQRRKTLVNALSSVCDREQVREALLSMGLGQDIRGERLSLEEFALLCERLKGVS